MLDAFNKISSLYICFNLKVFITFHFKLSTFLCFQILECNKDTFSPIDENIQGKKEKPKGWWLSSRRRDKKKRQDNSRWTIEIDILCLIDYCISAVNWSFFRKMTNWRRKYCTKISFSCQDKDILHHWQLGLKHPFLISPKQDLWAKKQTKLPFLVRLTI